MLVVLVALFFPRVLPSGGNFGVLWPYAPLQAVPNRPLYGSSTEEAEVLALVHNLLTHDPTAQDLSAYSQIVQPNPNESSYNAESRGTHVIARLHT